MVDCSSGWFGLPIDSLLFFQKTQVKLKKFLGNSTLTELKTFNEHLLAELDIQSQCSLKFDQDELVLLERILETFDFRCLLLCKMLNLVDLFLKVTDLSSKILLDLLYIRHQMVCPFDVGEYLVTQLQQMIDDKKKKKKEKEEEQEKREEEKSRRQEKKLDNKAITMRRVLREPQTSYRGSRSAMQSNTFGLKNLSVKAQMIFGSSKGSFPHS
ncbi:hypothetical protein COCNU_scaffold000419G000010 [Cocos nucifera]|nr:hypothetical protein [Cocos nucifera]